MTSQTTNDVTRREWRNLGFFYDRDDQAKTWKLVGSRSGSLKFGDALLAYATNEGNAKESEHEHYGPYGYLEIMTWREAGFDDQAIRGSLPELERLGKMVGDKLAAAQPGDAILIQSEYSPNSPYALILEVREDGFDPADADSALSNEII
jgi:hypothetical protein